MDRNARRRLSRLLNNPSLGGMFKRLTKTFQRQVTELVAAGDRSARKRLKELDEQRRAVVRARSAERRRKARELRETTGARNDLLARAAAKMAPFGEEWARDRGRTYSMAKQIEAMNRHLTTHGDQQIRLMLASTPEAMMMRASEDGSQKVADSPFFYHYVQAGYY